MSVFTGKILGHLHQQEIVPFPLLLHVFARFSLLGLDIEFSEEACFLEPLLFSIYVKIAWNDYCFCHPSISLV